MNDPYKILNVSRDASDEVVKKAYLNLARKYHPDNYHDNPLADLAQEKMKEINAAYEQVTKERGNGRNGGSSGGSTASYGGFGGSGFGGSGFGGGYGSATQRAYTGSSAFQQVRIAINQGDLTRAEGLLTAMENHDGEWNFLKGTICYRRGWLDEAKRYFTTACQIDPNNREYREALSFMEGGGQTAYQQTGGFTTESCMGDGLCNKLCCTYLLCNGCGYAGCRCI